MTQFPKEMKPAVIAKLMERREKFDGTDAQFARQWEINQSVFSQLKNGHDPEGLLRDGQWLNIARELDIDIKNRKWKTVRTSVFKTIEDDIVFCQQHSKSLMLVDHCGIGKTYTAKHLSKTLKNCFYIDCRQSPTKNEFIRALAKVIGVEAIDKLSRIRENIKYLLRMLPSPCVILDEAGALDDKAAMFVIELWNATENACGWYMMGADGLRAKFERNIQNEKVGWAELFSRFNEKYMRIVPIEPSEKKEFYTKLITDVIAANVEDKSKVPGIVKKCLVNDSGRISGLRRADTLVLLHS